VSYDGGRCEETAVARRLLLVRMEMGRGRAMLDDNGPFYHVRGGRRRDGWRPGGRRRLTSGPGVGLSATDRWATLQLFSNLKINAKIKLSTGKMAKG
jgi:hypothetical protein